MPCTASVGWSFTFCMLPTITLWYTVLHLVSRLRRATSDYGELPGCRPYAVQRTPTRSSFTSATTLFQITSHRPSTSWHLTAIGPHGLVLHHTCRDTFLSSLINDASVFLLNCWARPTLHRYSLRLSQQTQCFICAYKPSHPHVSF